MNWSTVLDTLPSSRPKASICLMLVWKMASKVPRIRSATKVGKAMARSVCCVTLPIWLAARGLKSLACAVASAGDGRAGGTGRLVRVSFSTGVWPSFSDCQ